MKKVLKKKRFYVALLCLFFFLLILILVLKKGVLNLDYASYDLIKKYLINNQLTPYIKFLTNLGGALVLIVFSFIILIFIKNKKISWAIILNLIISFILNILLKVIIQRNRPITDNWLIMENGYSFPSGHSSVSMSFYGFLIYLIYTNLPNKKYRWPLIIFLSLIILFVGISRVYLGVHYLSDVLAGFLFSIVLLIIYIYFYNHLIDNSTNS